jgi:hypothetical protein
MVILTVTMLVLVLLNLAVTVGISIRLKYLSETLAAERQDRQSVPPDTGQIHPPLRRFG